MRVTLTLASWGEATGTTATSGSREQEQTHPKLKYVRSQICVTPLTNEMCLIKKRWILYFWRPSLKEASSLLFVLFLIQIQEREVKHYLKSSLYVWL